jgi:hypothetical protein
MKKIVIARIPLPLVIARVFIFFLVIVRLRVKKVPPERF